MQVPNEYHDDIPIKYKRSIFLENCEVLASAGMVLSIVSKEVN